MRIKTVKEICATFKEVDGGSAVNPHMIRNLFDDKQIKLAKRGNRLVADMDQITRELNQLFDLGLRDIVPRIRSIHEAYMEVKVLHPELGISESRIRFLVDRDLLPHITVGNRVYIALDSFEEPFNDCLFYDDYLDSEEALIERIVNEEREKMYQSSQLKTKKKRT